MNHWLSISLGPLALGLLLLLSPAGGSASDSRADHSDLPEGETAWWPSRYGADDQLGTLNEVSPEVVRAAVALVRTGTVVDLGRVLDESTPKFPGRYWQQSVDVSPYFTNLRRSDAVGKGWGKNQINWITEVQSGTFQVGTQLDSIGHIQIGDRFYNGWRARDVVEAWGLNRFGMETIPPIVTRGILIDIAGLQKVSQLSAGYVITLAEVKAALHQQGLVVKPGDAVLFHTGGPANHVRQIGLVWPGKPRHRRAGPARRTRIYVYVNPCEDPRFDCGRHLSCGSVLK